jgi:hypothetical protein
MNMRSVLCVVAIGWGCACAPSFSVPLSGSETIPSGNLLSCTVAPFFPGFSNFDISQTQEFQNQGATKQNIQSVTLQSLVLTVTAPPGANLGFLESLSFSASDPSGNLPTVEVAHTSDFSGSPTSVNLTIDVVQLGPYAELPSMNLSSNAQLQSCPSQDTTLEASLVLNVTLQ